MPKYILNGSEVSINDIELAAKFSSLSLEDYISQNNIEIIEDEGKSMDPVMEAADAGSTDQTQQPTMVSTSEDTSSASQETDPVKYLIAPDGTIVYEDDYMSMYAGKQAEGRNYTYPKEFSQYALDIKSDVQEAAIVKRTKDIDISESINTKSPKQIQNELNSLGFQVVPQGFTAAEASASYSYYAQQAPSYQIKSANGNFFTLSTENPDIAELNQFLNENRPASGAAQGFVAKFGYINTEFNEALINGQVQSPSYELLDNISNTAENILRYYSGAKNIKVGDDGLTYNDLYSFAEDFQNASQEEIINGTAKNIIKSLKNRKIIDGTNTDEKELFGTIKEFLQKKNYYQYALKNISDEIQADRRVENNYLDAPQEYVTGFQQKSTENDSPELKARIKPVQDLDQLSQQIFDLRQSPEWTLEKEQALQTQLQNAKTTIENTPITQEGFFTEKINAGLFDNYKEALTPEQKINFEDLSAEEQVDYLISILDEKTGEIKQTVIDSANANNITRRDALKDEYSFMVQEYYNLDHYGRNTNVTLNIDYLKNRKEFEVGYLDPTNVGLNRQLKEKTYYTRAQEILGREDVGSVTVQEYIKLQKELKLTGDIQEELPAEVKLYKGKKNQLDLRETALRYLYLYNIDPADLEVSKTQMFTSALGNALAPPKKYDSVSERNEYGSNRFALDQISSYAAEFNSISRKATKTGTAPQIEFTAEQEKAIERTFGQQFAEFTGGMIPVLGEFMILGGALKGLYSIGGFANRLKSLALSNSLSDRMLFHAFQMAEEGIKFSIIERPETFGEGMKAFATGAAFKAGGLIAGGRVGKLKGKTSFFNQYLDAVVGGSIGGVAGSNVSQITGAYVDSLMNDSDFNQFIEDNYTGEDVNLWRKIWVEAASFAALGFVGPAMSAEGYWKNYQKRTSEINKQLDTFASEIATGKDINTGKQLTPEQILNKAANMAMLSKYNQYRLYDARYREDNPNLEANVSAWVNNQLKAVDTGGAKGDPVKIQFVETSLDIPDLKAQGKNTNAYWMPSNKTIYFVKGKFNRGVMVHETIHAAISTYLSNMGKDSVALFKQDLLSKLEKVYGAKGEALVQRINEQYGLKLTELDKAESTEELIANIAQIFASDVFVSDYVGDNKHQSLFTEIQESFIDIFRRANTKVTGNKNLSPQAILYLLRRMGTAAQTGKDVSKSFERLLPAILEGSVMPAEGKSAGRESRRLNNEEAYEEYNKAATLYEEGKITEVEHDLALQKFQLAIEENKRQTEVVSPTISEAKDKVEDISFSAAKAKAEVDGAMNQIKNSDGTWNNKIISNLDGMIQAQAFRRKNLGLQFDMQSLVSEVQSTLLRDLELFDATKNDSLYGYLNGRIKWRIQDAFESGKVDVQNFNVITGEQAGLENFADNATESFTDNIDLGKSQGKGTAPGKLMGEAYDSKAVAEIQRKIKEVDLSKESLSSLEGLATETISEFTGVSESQLFTKTSNLTNEPRYEIITPEGKRLRDKDGNPVLKYKKGVDSYLKKNPGSKQGATILSESEKLRQAIVNMGKNFLNIFPELNIVAELRKGEPYYNIPGEKDIIGRSVGLPRTLTKYLYSELINPKTGKPYRGNNPASQTVVQNLNDLSFEGLARLINKVRGEKFEKPDNVSDKEWLKIQRDNQQFLKGLFDWYNKMVTNEIVRRDSTLSIYARVALEAGKPKGMASRKLNVEEVKSFEEAFEKHGKGKTNFDSIAEKIRIALKDENSSPIAIADRLLSITNTYFKGKEAYKLFTQEAIPFLRDIAGKITESEALALIAKYRKVHKYESKKAGYDESKTNLKNKLAVLEEARNASSKPEEQIDMQEKTVLEWLKNYSRGGRTEGYDGYKNSDIYENVIGPAIRDFAPELIKDFGVLKSKTGNKTYITHKGEILGGYTEINYIKNDFEGSRDLINKDSNEAIDFVWETLDGYVNAGNKGAAIDFVNFGSVDMRGPIRKISKAGFSMREANFNNSILEHDVEVNQITDALIDYIKNPTSKNRKIANDLMQEGRVNFVTLEFNNALSKVEKTYGLKGKARYQHESIKKLYLDLLNKGEIVTEADANAGRASRKLNITEEVDKRIETLFPEVKGEINRVMAAKSGAEKDAGILPNILKFKTDPEAQDFLGLMQGLVPKGKEGNRVLALHKKLFTDPFNVASNKIDADQVYVSGAYRNIRRHHNLSENQLQEKIPNSVFRTEDAIRVWIWNKFDHTIPELSEVDKTNLLSHVNSNKQLRSFASSISNINGKFGFAKPENYWYNTGLKADIQDALAKINRPAYLRTWQKNIDDYFTDGNLNKMEAALGTRWRKAMENSLFRQRTGKNRHYTVESQVGQFENALSGAVLNTLHWNNKSALLQLTSATNFINWTDNNPIAAAKAFANQPQYWKDFIYLFNSEFLKQRRGQLKLDITDADIAEAATQKGFLGLQAKLLKIGMTPTVVADNIAIAGGGATFYRNRLNYYLRQGGKANEMLAYNASPKSFAQLGERSGLIYLATNPREAKAYAEMNRGEVKNIYIDKNKIASEKDLIDTMNELGINTSEGLTYELIDPRFEGFYIGKENMQKVVDALAKKGFKAARYEDGAQVVSGKVESIVVFDKSVISDKKGGVKGGMSESEASKRAYADFRESAETSQQSSRADKLSMQQTGPLGRIALAYTNTPQQYFREMNKAYNNLVNRRGDDKTNVSKMLYYGAMANMLFVSLQGGVNTALFAPDEVEVPNVMDNEQFKNYVLSLPASQRLKVLKQRKEDLKIVAKLEKENKKKVDANLTTINGMMDTTLKGMGLHGQVLSVLKNAGFRAYIESQKDRPDYAGEIPATLIGISPGASIKYNYIRRGLRTLQYNKEEIAERGLSDFDNPIYSAGADLTAGFTNFPLNIYLRKRNNIANALNEEYSTATRILSLAGWSEYSLGIPKEKYQKHSDEFLLKLEEHKKAMYQALTPYQRGLYLKWKKEFEQKQKEKK